MSGTMSTAKKKDYGSLINQFCTVTGASEEVGKTLLEACDGNLELAIEMHMEGGGVTPGVEEQESSSAAAEASDVADAGLGVYNEVRAPIPQIREMLVEEAPVFGFRGRRRKARSVFDGFRDFQAEARQQEQMLQGGEGAGVAQGSKYKTLEDLFRPPIDITYKGTFFSAREAGTSQKKWLMVNIQNVQEFPCQALNRDVWSNSAVKSIVKEHFIFWQVYNDSEEGKKYTQFYKVQDWPYVAILDPQTGENLVTWHSIDSLTFCDLVTEFLTQHPCVDGVQTPPKKRFRREESIVDATEDDQLQAAISASLKEVTSPKEKDIVVDDNDSCSDSDIELETFTDSESESQHSPMKSSHLRLSQDPKGSPSKVRSGSPCNRASSSKISELNSAEGKRPVSKLITETTECVEISDKPCSAVEAISDDSQETVQEVNRDKDRDNTVDKDSKNNSTDEVKETKHSLNKSSSEGDQSLSHDESKDSSFSFDKDPQDYKSYLGKEDDAMYTLMLKLPDGSREPLTIPSSSKLMAVILYVRQKGFSNERYELVTQFPRRELSQLDFDATLSGIGLHPQENIFIQAR